MDLELNGRRALITGGTRGIGLSIATRLGQEGCRVAICGRSLPDLALALRQLRDAGIDAIGRAVDVADTAQVAAWMAQMADAMGGFDIHVSNACSMIDSPDLNSWRRAMDVDLIGVVNAVELMAPMLEAAGGGAIVVVGSIAARDVRAPVGPYAALKAALLPMVKGWAHRYGPAVRVNCVSPGPILFPGGFWDAQLHHDPAPVNQMAQSIPLRRLGTPGEVADLVAFLVSTRAAYITGANFTIDGGASHAV